MDTRNVDELIAEAEKIADAKNKPTSNSSNNDDDEYSDASEPGVRRVRATVPAPQSQCSGQ